MLRGGDQMTLLDRCITAFVAAVEAHRFDLAEFWLEQALAMGADEVRRGGGVR